MACSLGPKAQGSCHLGTGWGSYTEPITMRDVELARACRLIGDGPTSLVSRAYGAGYAAHPEGGAPAPAAGSSSHWAIADSGFLMPPCTGTWQPGLG